MAEQSWGFTDRERRGMYVAAAAAMSTFLGPWGPLAVWAFEFVYDRRDLIFNAAGTPVRAYTADRSPLGLSTLARPGQSTLSIDTTLTASARRLGLRDGDPVSVSLTGHNYAQAPSGLVIPARLGRPLTVTVPSGDYAVAAFGSRRENLFSRHDPYQTIGGSNVSAQGVRRIALPLNARAMPVLAPAARLPIGWCMYCNQPLPANALLHTMVCPSKPGRITGQLVRPRCEWCELRFTDERTRRAHMRDAHPVFTWWRDWIG